MILSPTVPLGLSWRYVGLVTPSAQFVLVVLDSLVQLVVLTLIPFLVYAISKRRVTGFFAWIGLKRAPSRAVLLGLGITLVLSFSAFWFMKPVLEEEGTVTGKLVANLQEHGWSVWLIGTVLVTAWIKTGLTEEIFFRGFVGARLIAWLGFARGNLLQAALFAGIHLLVLSLLPEDQQTLLFAAVFFFFPGLSGWIMGYINHHMARGSILPSWAMHGLGNTIGYSLPLILAA